MVISLADALAALPDIRARLHMKAPGASVRDVTTDSRAVERGSIFVAIRGTAVDGRRFIRDAVRRGAVAVVADEPPDAGVERGTPFVLVDDARSAAGRLASRFFGEPSQTVSTIGITGTNGKTTTACMTAAILRAAGDRPGVLGTIGIESPAGHRPAPTTTPDPVTIHEVLAEVRDGGGRSAVMEVSSHALEQRRVAGVRFATAVFTNLSGDHLDYHGDMDAYARAKRRLFEQLDPRATAVLNARDPAARFMAEGSAAPAVFYAIDDGAGGAPGAGEPAVSARVLDTSLEGSRLAIRFVNGDEIEVMLRQPGRHNVENALAAAAATRSVGVPLAAIAAGLEAASTVPGRLERVSPPGSPAVLVDYAHTDDALRNVLGAVRPLTRGRLVVVFGCGGDRDRSKRPRMAAVAEAGADVAIVTSDNPRSEDPSAIIDEIRTGFEHPERHAVRVDRREAIRHGIESLRAPGDVLIVAGKGHEDYQITAEGTVHFDDREEARRALAELWGGRRPEAAIREASDSFQARSAG